MVEAKVDSPTVNVIKDPLDVEITPLQDVFSEMLTVARQAIVELARGQVCVATIHDSQRRIDLTTPIPISRQRLERIRLKLAATGEDSDSTVQPNDIACTINGSRQESYVFGSGPNNELHHEVLIPISAQGASVGFLYLGSFDSAFDLTQSKLIHHFSTHFARTLRHLWYLNIRQKEKFELIASRIFDGIIFCDARQRIQYINVVAKKLLCCEMEQAWQGKPLSDLGAEFLTDFIYEALNAGIYELNKVTNIPGSSSKLLGVHLELLKNFRNNQIGWLIILRDVTKNWQNDQMRSAMSIAGHEIKTPLNSILGAVDLLLDNDLGELNQKQQQCLNIVKDDISRLNRLISDILDLSRFDEGIQFLDRRKEIALDFMVTKVLKSLESFATSKHVLIENKIPKNLPSFKGNRDRLQQVLVNLIENAIK
ncbi:PAS domain-containing sensor histidine kinase, partial [bacterium]|nr:PAS domain-containing sensor histidine kinase [bacterium]